MKWTMLITNMSTKTLPLVTRKNFPAVAETTEDNTLLDMYWAKNENEKFFGP